ncbi:MAG: hypothetical protein J0M21_00255 [Xanthomonadales bacterium]|nr:hypothetical protein [Xanthomonadales bacterium]
MSAPRILKGNADLVPYFHPIVLPDGRVPCDACGAAIIKDVAERNAEVWDRGVCDHCADALLEANPDWPRAAGVPHGQA